MTVGWPEIPGDDAADAERNEYDTLSGLVGGRVDTHEFWYLDSTHGSSVGAESTGGTGALTAGLRRMIFTTGANASSFKQLYMSNLGGRADVPTADADWGFSWRVKLTTTPDAQTIFQFGGGAVVGFRGAVSTTNFIAFVTGQSITGPAVDTDWHIMRLIRRSGVTRFYVDGILYGSNASLKPSANSPLLAEIYNQATAAAQTMQVSWLAAYVPKAA